MNAKKGRTLKCLRCSYHGITMMLKNHKNHCQFQECACDSCSLLTLRNHRQALNRIHQELRAVRRVIAERESKNPKIIEKREAILQNFKDICEEAGIDNPFKLMIEEKRIRLQEPTPYSSRDSKPGK